MPAKINSKYLENYASEFTSIVCDDYFMTNKFMTGQGIIQLTPSSQVNFFILKALFEAWQSELEKLKSNPYFDYRNKSVHDALRDFMNVLSRSIKIERKDFEPLFAEAVAYSIVLAVDPIGYFTGEFGKVNANLLNDYLKENKKYFKWHSVLISNLIDRAGLGHTHEAYLKALSSNYEDYKNELDSSEGLLKSLNEVRPLELDKLMEVRKNEIASSSHPEHISGRGPATIDGQREEDSRKIETSVTALDPEEKPESQQDAPTAAPSNKYRVATGSKAIDPLMAWNRFESEEYTIMKGSIGKLSESVGINQRFMFTKELFDGNPDLLKHALKSIDGCESFAEAIKLLNDRFVEELNWDKESDSVDEFLQLIYRKFDQKA